LIIKTASGSRYEIDESSKICRKFNSEGKLVDSFKAYSVKSVRKDVQNLKELKDARKFKPMVGKRLYIAGTNVWWLSTEIVSIVE
jgi:hypothetical protein